jgi:hypothetical protein
MDPPRYGSRTMTAAELMEQVDRIREVQKEVAAALAAGQIEIKGERWNTTSDALNQSIRKSKLSTIRSEA